MGATGMRVRNFILADAIAGDGLYFLHGAGLGRIQVREFPHIHPTISLLVTLVLERGDEAGEPEFKIALAQGDGQPVDVIMQGKIQLPEIPVGPDQDEPVINLVARKVGMRVPGQGRHWVTLEVGGIELDRTPLVIEVLPPVVSAAQPAA
jgi:hypothetical protein